MDDDINLAIRDRSSTSAVGAAPSAADDVHMSDVSRDGLVVAVERIASARSRGTQPSDGGSSGKSDTNDG